MDETLQNTRRQRQLLEKVQICTPLEITYFNNHIIFSFVVVMGLGDYLVQVEIH